MKSTMKKALSLALILAMVLTLVACQSPGSTSGNGGASSGGSSAGQQSGGNSGGEPLLITIGTGTVGGGWYSMGGALANVLTEHMPNASVTSIATNASLENMSMLQADKLEIAMANTDVVYQSARGLNGYAAYEGMNTLCMMDEIYLTVFVADNSGIQSFKDLKGKRLGTGTAGSGLYLMVEAILNEYGWTYDDVQPYQASTSQQCDALKDGNIDACCFLMTGKSGASSTVVELTSTFDCHMIPVDDEQIKSLNSKAPYYLDDYIPANWVESNPEPVHTFGLNTQMLVREDMDEQVAYDLIKTIMEHMDDLTDIHSAFKVMTKDSVANGMSVPLHPGAERYLKEIGATIAYLD